MGSGVGSLAPMLAERAAGSRSPNAIVARCAVRGSAAGPFRSETAAVAVGGAAGFVHVTPMIMIISTTTYFIIASIANVAN